jgi:hypothetical protein
VRTRRGAGAVLALALAGAGLMACTGSGKPPHPAPTTQGPLIIQETLRLTENICNVATIGNVLLPPNQATRSPGARTPAPDPGKVARCNAYRQARLALIGFYEDLGNVRPEGEEPKRASELRLRQWYSDDLANRIKRYALSLNLHGFTVDPQHIDTTNVLTRAFDTMGGYNPKDLPFATISVFERTVVKLCEPNTRQPCFELANDIGRPSPNAPLQFANRTYIMTPTEGANLNRADTWKITNINPMPSYIA